MQEGDLATIATPLDFLGVNNYSRTIVRAGPTAEARRGAGAGGELTAMGWEVYPDGLREVLCRLHDEYGPRRCTSPRTAPPTATCAHTTDGFTTSSASRTSTRISAR